MKKFISLMLITMVVTNVYSQGRTIQGRVIDDLYMEPVPFVSFRINDTIEVGKSSIEGFFQISIPDTISIIQLIAIAEPAIIHINEFCNDIDIVMLTMGYYDFISLKKVDRLLMKRFKQLPKLHKQAYEKGIFKTEQPCYTREFIPYYKGKKKKAE